MILVTGNKKPVRCTMPLRAASIICGPSASSRCTSMALSSVTTKPPTSLKPIPSNTLKILNNKPLAQLRNKIFLTIKVNKGIIKCNFSKLRNLRKGIISCCKRYFFLQNIPEELSGHFAFAVPLLVLSGIEIYFEGLTSANRGVKYFISLALFILPLISAATDIAVYQRLFKSPRVNPFGSLKTLFVYLFVQLGLGLIAILPIIISGRCS